MNALVLYFLDNRVGQTSFIFVQRIPCFVDWGKTKKMSFLPAPAASGPVWLVWTVGTISIGRYRYGPPKRYWPAMNIHGASSHDHRMHDKSSEYVEAIE